MPLAGLLTDASIAALRFQPNAMVATTNLSTSIHTTTLAQRVQGFEAFYSARQQRRQQIFCIDMHTAALQALAIK
jgi:hypothetical protein